jgi:Uma2 family endonuclease
MATATACPILMTVEQYRELPENESVIQELHWGRLVELTRPKLRHVKIQSRLVRLLRPKAEHLGVIESEAPFRALPEFELRAADVAFITQQRWDAADDDDNLNGSPELVIEVLSPSNTKPEMNEKAALFLSTGAKEFWVVSPRKKTVTVITSQNSVVYSTHQKIPLTLFGGFLSVAEIFEIKKRGRKRRPPSSSL